MALSRQTRLLALLCGAAADDGETSVSQALNAQIARSDDCVFCGGGGVLVRTPDFFSGEEKVHPATFWTNDIYAPNQLYPIYGNAWCPTADDSYVTPPDCYSDGSPWGMASVAIVVGSGMWDLFYDYDNIQSADWGWGVFYATDSNACDKRCGWSEADQTQSGQSGWTCPGGWVGSSSGTFFPNSDQKGAGYRNPGNPYAGPYKDDRWGGGAGCHFDTYLNNIDQTDVYGDTQLTQDYYCQCNYGLNYDWGDWVDLWVGSAKNKDNYEWRTWFGDGNLAPFWAADIVMCWHNNPRDMINLQNAMYWKSWEWNSGLQPNTYGDDTVYWGWNEVPVSAAAVEDPLNWDAVILKLPPNVCQASDYGLFDMPGCLSSEAWTQLGTNLMNFENGYKLYPGWENVGNRPGSYVLFVREYAVESGWNRFFFCADYPLPERQVVYKPMDGNLPSGACYYDYQYASMNITV